MSFALYAVIAGILGLAFGPFTALVFNKVPEKWLQDYDYDPNAKDFRLSKRMRLVPETILSSAFCLIFCLFPLFFCQAYVLSGAFFKLAIIVFSTPFMFLVLISDRLNRIIPDQFTVAVGIFGIAGLVSDYVEGCIWFSYEAAWYAPLINRIGAALLGAGFLLLVNFLCRTFIGKDGLGGGDIKLIFCCGLLTGIYGLVIMTYISCFTALLVAVPLFIRKKMRQRKEEQMIRESDDPVKARQELKIKKSQIHYADDPDALALGPFLVIGTCAAISMELFFFEFLFTRFGNLGIFF